MTKQFLPDGEKLPQRSIDAADGFSRSQTWAMTMQFLQAKNCLKSCLIAHRICPLFLEPFPKSNLVLNWEMSWKEWIDKMLQNHRHHQIVLMQGRIDAADCKRAMTMQLLPAAALLPCDACCPIWLYHWAGFKCERLFCRWQLILVLQYLFWQCNFWLCKWRIAFTHPLNGIHDVLPPKEK